VLDKIANDLDVNVSFEQREANFAERVLDVALGDSALALELFEDAFEAVAERVKHKYAAGYSRSRKLGFAQ
jgi:hypothetical protein